MAESQLEALFSAGLENHEDQDDGTIAGGSDSMEAVMLDVEQAYGEVIASEADVDRLHEIETGLEEVCASMEAVANNRGGMTQEMAQFAHHAVDAYTSPLGLPSDKVLPALESFGGDSGQQSATTVSVEGVKETLAKIWNAIKKAIEKAVKAIGDFFSKIFGGTGKIKQRISALEKQVGQLGGAKVKDKAKVKVGSPNSLQHGGKVDASALKSGMDNLQTVNEAMFGPYVDSADDLYGKLADLITSTKDKDAEKDAEEAIRELAKYESQTFGTVLKDKKQGLSVPGDKAFTVTTEEKGGVELAWIKFQNIQGYKSFSGSSEIDPLSASDMSTLLDGANKVVEAIDNSKSKIDQAQKARKDGMDAVKKIVDESERGKVGSVWNKAKGQVLMRLTERAYLKPMTTLAKYDFGVLRSLLAVVESSVKQYETSNNG